MINKEQCVGCGAILQTEDPTKKGYLPKKVYQERSLPLCQRCFRLQHYGVGTLDSEQVQFDISLFEKARLSHALLIYVLDLSTFPFLFFEQIHPFLQGLDVLLIANKRDILPQSWKKERLRFQILQICKEKGLKTCDLLIVSTRKGEEKEEFIKRCRDELKKRDLYFIGVASAGKSSLINLLFKKDPIEEKLEVTTSIFPGTTVETIRIALPNQHAIYDTPGREEEGMMGQQVEKSILPLLILKKEIKPRIYQLQSQQSLHIGGLARCDFLEGEKSSFVVYAAPSVKIIRSKLEKAENTFFSLIHQKEIAPTSMRYQTKDDFVEQLFHLCDGVYRITIAGYAWLQIKGKNLKIRMIFPKKVKIDCRKEK